MLISSRNKIPFPDLGKNSGGAQQVMPSLGTGKPRKSVGASWLNLTSTKPSPCSSATCLTILDFPIPGAPHIIALRSILWVIRSVKYDFNCDGLIFTQVLFNSAAYRQSCIFNLSNLSLFYGIEINMRNQSLYRKCVRRLQTINQGRLMAPLLLVLQSAAVSNDRQATSAALLLATKSRKRRGRLMPKPWA